MAGGYNDETTVHKIEIEDKRTLRIFPYIRPVMQQRKMMLVKGGVLTTSYTCNDGPDTTNTGVGGWKPS
jgi:hypothetical protein